MKRQLMTALCCVMLFAGGCAGNTAADTKAASTSEKHLGEEEAATRELYAMDTVMTLTAYGSNADAGLDAAIGEINRLDSLLSISSESGEIYKINRDGEGDVSEDVEELLASAIRYSEETGGLFDATIEPVMESWGFTDKNYRVPTQEELAALLKKVDSSKVELSEGHVKLPEGVRLDLGGIAKGFTSARVMDIFKEAGVKSGIISLGGNVQALGTKTDGTRWRVGIQDPKDQNTTFAIVEVADEAVITSGAYQRYFEENGVHYHHIIDPRTGYPAQSGLSSATIVTADGTLADALSTSLFIMGADDAAKFWRAHRDEFEAVLMADDGTVWITEGLADRCKVTTGGKVEVIS